MWGSSIIGFGEHTIKYAGGREAKWMLTGFAPRKQNIALYTGSEFPEHDDLLGKLGTHSCGKGCPRPGRDQTRTKPDSISSYQAFVRDHLRQSAFVQSALNRRGHSPHQIT